MKIDDLIRYLKYIRDTEGNIPVVFAHHGGYFSLSNLSDYISVEDGILWRDCDEEEHEEQALFIG